MIKVKYLLQCMLLVVVCSSAQAGDIFPVETIHYTGNKNNRINIVFMGDGYTASQQNLFIQHVRNITEGLFKVSPYREYRSFFNVYAIKVVSQQSGIDHPRTANDCPPLNYHPIQVVDTYFDSTFDSPSGIHRGVRVKNFSKAIEVLLDHIPIFSVAVVLVNSHYSGGTGGYPIVMTTTDEGKDMIETFQHELGHSLGELADEYDYDNFCDGPEHSNATQQALSPPWKTWISNPIPTPDGTQCNQIGLYEGANHCTTGWYRPACTCKMKNASQHFCTVCTESLIKNILGSVELYEGWSPPLPDWDDPLKVKKGETQAFAVSTLKTDYSKSNYNFSSTPAAGVGPLCISPNTITYYWFLNNVSVGTPSSPYLFKADDNKPTMNTLCFKAYDYTHWAKTLPSDNIYNQLSCWRIEIIP